MTFNLNGKQFKTLKNAENGEVSGDTHFVYGQKEDIIWADYSGGQILKGSIIGKIVDDHLEFVYQHINSENELMTGRCKSYPEMTKDGKLMLKEFWQWTCKDHSKGQSTIIEI